MKVICSLTGNTMDAMSLFHPFYLFYRENSPLCVKHPTTNNQSRTEEVYDSLIYLCTCSFYFNPLKSQFVRYLHTHIYMSYILVFVYLLVAVGAQD